MTKKLRVFPFLLLLLGFLTGCEETFFSDDVDRNQIWVTLKLMYFGEEDSTGGYATLNDGDERGNPVVLSEGSYVNFNGESLLPIESNQIYYGKKLGGLVESGEFSWMESDAEIFRHSKNLRTIGFPPEFTHVDRTRAYELEWIGAPIAEGESVQVTLRFDGKCGPDRLVFEEETPLATKITLDAETLSRASLGEASVSIRRAQEESFGKVIGPGGVESPRGKIFLDYQSPEVFVEVF